MSRKVTIVRVEHFEHTFEIPENVEIGSGQYDDIIDGFNWKNAMIYHAEETISKMEGCEFPPDPGECGHCGSRYTEYLDDDVECYDCGKITNKEEK